MICPMRYIGWMALPAEHKMGEEATLCVSAKCSWWSKEDNSCAVALAGKALGIMALAGMPGVKTSVTAAE